MRDAGYNLVLEAAGLQKHGAVSSLGSDFIAGMDPFGVWTNPFGREAERAGLSESEHALKRGIGTAGGVLGGAALVPSGIFGIVEAAKGFGGAEGNLKKRLAKGLVGGLEGFQRPIKSVLEGRNARGALRRMAQGGAGLEPSELESLKYIASGAMGDPERAVSQLREIEPLGKVLDLADMITPEHISDLTRSWGSNAPTRHGANIMATKVDELLGSAQAQLGLGGAIGGTGAYYQYGAGRQTERETSPLARLKRRLGL